jgi:hypothetical protein
MTSDGYDDPPERGLDRYDPCEIDPPAPLQIFTRLGLLLMIALGLVAELLVRLPSHWLPYAGTPHSLSNAYSGERTFSAQ